MGAIVRLTVTVTLPENTSTKYVQLCVLMDASVHMGRSNTGTDAWTLASASCL